ncbi:MAG: NAD(P)-dependent alcohol dehydrogenase, partial [Actinomycetota bacterium]|nr:NAD(P)-dependent alcohol dehydrogenase [Actinomycetota bacterium]
GLVRPRHRIPGTELAGEVVAAGPAVSRFTVGDQVFGVSSKTGGTHAEYVALSESLPLAYKPEAMSFEEAAAAPDGAILALSFLRKMDLERRRKVLVYGASGSIGVAGVQLAAGHYGADVTAVCDTRHLDLVRSLGPTRVIDYTTEDFTKSEERYDIVFDAVGKLSLKQVKTALGPRGIYASSDLGPHWQNPFLAIWTPGDKKVLFPIPRYRKEEVILLKELIDAGTYRAVIDRRYSLEDVVEAHRYVETGQKTGNVVLSITPAATS